MAFRESVGPSDYVPLAVLSTSAENRQFYNVRPEYRHKRRSLVQRIGAISLLTIFLGSTALLLPVTLMALFWKESINAIGEAEPQRHWAHVINANWATRLVTVCTTVIRSMVSLQAGVVTAMVAAIVMETSGISLLQGPIYSTLRAVKAAPTSLFVATDFRPHLSFFIGILVAIEVIATTASQFQSTIFLSDFADGSFTLVNNSTNVRILENTYTSASGWWTMLPAASWTFAEVSEPFAEGPGYHDTGHTYRAFLPFENETQRTKLRRLSGPVPVMDHRVVCANPSLNNLTLHAATQGNMQLSGQIAMENKSYPMLLNTESQLDVDFYCQTNHTTGLTSICCPSAGGANNWIVLLEDPLVPPTANDSSVGGHTVASAVFMILDVTSEEALMGATGGTYSIQTTRMDGPWAMVENGSDVETLRISVCFTNLGAETITVAVNSSFDIQEPTMSWDSQAHKYITESSRRQLGASRARENLFSRGVLTLAPKIQWQPFQLQGDEGGYNTPWLFSMQLTNSLPAGVGTVGDTTTAVFRGVILSQNAFSGAMIAHLGHINMFQDTLYTTESPALASQVLLTRISQMIYYEQLVKMNIEAAAETAFSVTAPMLVQWTGFIIGMGLTAAHLIILIIVTVYFMSCTVNYFIGNYWQAVSHVVSNESRPILEQADNMTDKQVERWARHQAVDIKSRRVLRYRDDGRIALDVTED